MVSLESVVPDGMPNLGLVDHVDGFVRVATMLLLRPRPSAMTAVTVALLLGAVLNRTSTSVKSKLAVLPVSNRWATSPMARLPLKAAVVWPRLDTNVSRIVLRTGLSEKESTSFRSRSCSGLASGLV